MWIPIILACVQFLVHVLTNNNYGIFRDEFYYLACADHLAWGYVDHPPLSIALLAVSRALFGDSVQAIRIFSELASALVVVMAGLLAAELGGKRFAQGLSALCAAVVPSYLGITGFFSMNAFDLLFWAIAFYLVMRIINTGNRKLWLFFGVLMGLGLMNKLSTLFFGFALFGGLLLTSHRKMLLDKYLWLSGVLAGLIFLPHILWQFAAGWPTLEFMRNAQQYKIADLSPIQFMLGTMMEMHPFIFLLCLSGLIFLLFSRKNRTYRVFGLMYLILLVFFVVQKSKTYYFTPAHVILLAAGAYAIETWFATRFRWIKFVIVGLIVIGGLISAPLAIPVLPVETFVAYQTRLGIKPQASEKHGETLLPQHFADRFGWENMTKTIASVYQSLTPDQQTDCTIFASNYGEAGAINYYGRQYGLPQAISGHNNYHLWGYGKASGKIVISIGMPANELRQMFSTVSQAAIIVSPYAMPYETNLPVYLCSDPKVPIEKVWHEVKMFI